MAAGFGSLRRFNDLFKKRYSKSLEFIIIAEIKGVTMYYSTTYPSPVGLITLACDGDNLVGLWLIGQKYHGGTISETMIEKSTMPVFTAAKKWLNNYFAGKKPAVSELPLAPIGGEFRQGVWGILCEIPYGEVITYGGIAKKMAVKMNKKSMSSQAVGGAVGHNPISIIIPCHRVVGSNGSLTGYAGGIGTKVKLLTLEGVDMSSLFVPKRGTAL
jgi:methylated-DNA-[protein]-cysteine S-methyltransferase